MKNTAKLMSNKKKIKLVVFCLAIAALVVLAPAAGTYLSPVQASDDLYDELERLQKELEDIQNQKNSLQSSIDSESAKQGSLSSDIAKLDNEIAQRELDITEKETEIAKKEIEIKILEEASVETLQLIEKTQRNVEDLEQTASDIVTTIYIESKTNSALDILLKSQENTSFVTEIQYHTALGTKDQNTLEEYKVEKLELEKQRQSLEEDRLEEEKLAEQVKKQKEELEKDQEQLSAQKSQKNNLIAQSQKNINSYETTLVGLSDDKKKKIAEQNILIQKIFNEMGDINSGSFVLKDTIIGYEGSTGHVSGPHLHFTVTYNKLRHWGEMSSYCSADGCNPNPCNYLPRKESWNCGINNSSLIWPLKGSYSLTSGWGERCIYYEGGWHCGFHDAIDISHGYPEGSPIYAAHNGWIDYQTISGAKCAFICEKTNCNTGFKSGYCHLK